MQTKQKYGGLDRFRMAAAFLVIAIHISPLESLNAGADFFLTRVLARIAVPFFLMVTGQFVAARFLDSAEKGSAILAKYLKKMALIYLFCIVLYLPIGIYAGHYAQMTFGSLLRMLFFDGTFYHLWYFPACMLGMVLVYLMSRFMGLTAMTAVSAILYIIGLFGDSYFGLVQRVPLLESVYEFGFQISSYTRNGLFLAPLFLVLGMWIARLVEKRDGTIDTLSDIAMRAEAAERADAALEAAGKIAPKAEEVPEQQSHDDNETEKSRDRREMIVCCAGLALSFAVMTAEAFTLRHFELQRHDSMYFALVPTMFFLYICLMKLPRGPERLFRSIAMWIYVLHPAVIVAVRGIGKAFDVTAYIVDNSLVHFLLVLQFSLIAGVVMVYLQYCVLLKLLQSFDIRAWVAERIRSIREWKGKKGETADESNAEDATENAANAANAEDEVKAEKTAKSEDADQKEEEDIPYSADSDAIQMAENVKDEGNGKKEAADGAVAYETAAKGKRLILPPKKKSHEAVKEAAGTDALESADLETALESAVLEKDVLRKTTPEALSAVDTEITATPDVTSIVETEGELEQEMMEETEIPEPAETEEPAKWEKPVFPEIDPDEEMIARELAAEEERILRAQERKPIDLQKITLPPTVGFGGRHGGNNPKKVPQQKSVVPKKASMPEFGDAQGDFRAWIELDAAALANNVEFLRSRIPESCRLMPAVKAEAYGHGAVIIARQLNKLNVNAFCVACLSEGITLRKAGIKGKILILGYTSPDDFPLLSRYLLTQTVLDYNYAQALNRFGKQVHVHIAIDTGMHRLGIRCENLEEIASVYKMKNLIIDGLFTHLSASASLRPEDLAFTNSQVQAFYQVVDFLKNNGYPCRGLHILASYGILNLLTGKEKWRKNLHRITGNHGISNRAELAGDYVRPGIALYGVLETETDSILWQEHLKPVLSLKAKVVSVRDLYEGEAAGYGLAFTAKHDMKIATLSIGYADGLPRELSYGIGSVLINGCSAPIIGRICMDQTLVDVSNVPRIQPGSVAVLIGKSGGLEITAGRVADQCGTITNEILSRLGARLNRILV